ncbi:inactive protein RESTRICTED TEV MOVEMENT 2 [Elaeis guineensis]|uniref:Inactive protein RESTRICTED TEV MOVEMENT 2 n=1 Tax=Elaeis guineensis var. tenera TaxID=51953 RepID=A0A6I9R4Z3_ELAGV|nr:inactive protein RESTRICTED TEV MOVEMENT 2 [Elaeis guineensis]
METKAAAAQLVYEDFVPSHEVVRGEGMDTLVFKLPEFKKEQIRVQFENFENLRISGERPLGDNRWSRFRKDFQLEGCNEIRYKFENGRLEVSAFPKFLLKEVKKGKEKILVNIITAVVILVMMALYMTSKI